MNILVTGALGFLGRALVPILRRDASHAVFEVVLDEVAGEFTHRCDLTDANAVKALVDKIKPAEIYHLAGSFANQFEEDFRSNVLSTKNLLEAIADAQLPARMVVMGSAAEYGVVKESANPVSEEHPLNPSSMYGLSKMYQTALCQFYARLNGVDVKIARLFNLFGTGASQKLFIGRVEAQIAAFKSGQCREIVMQGRLDTFRDYLPVQDAAEAIIKVLRCGVAGEVYNIGHGAPTRMQDLLNTILKSAGIDPRVAVSRPVAQDNKIDIPVIFANIEKFKNLKAKHTS